MIKEKDNSLKLAQLKKKTDIQRKINMANKRLTRLESNNMQNLPAYRQFVDSSGQARFSVKGKSYNEVQSEIAKVEKFLNNKTSLVRGANSYLKNIAKKVGLDKTIKVSDLNNELSGFFEMASKIEQYLRVTNDSASAIGYQAIWGVMNEYVEKEGEEFQNVFDDTNQSMEDIIELITLQRTEDKVQDMNVFKLMK